MPSYSIDYDTLNGMPRLMPGTTKYGAKMGRYNSPGTAKDRDARRLFQVACIGPDAGGYDLAGAYWGLGNPVFWAHCTLTGADLYLRAETLHSAKAKVLEEYPNATFADMPDAAYEALKAEYRTFASGDLWADAMSWLWATINVLALRGTPLPDRWDVRLGAQPQHPEELDFPAGRLWEIEPTPDALIRFGDLLTRYLRMLRHLGLNY